MNIEEVKEWVNNEVYGRREFTLLALQKLDDSVEWLITEHDRLTKELSTTETRVRQECAEIVKATREGIDQRFNLKRCAIKGDDVLYMLNTIHAAILHGQQGQKVCEWENIGNGAFWSMGCGANCVIPPESLKTCPGCGLPIKIKEAP